MMNHFIERFIFFIFVSSISKHHRQRTRYGREQADEADYFGSTSCQWFNVARNNTGERVSAYSAGANYFWLDISTHSRNPSLPTSRRSLDDIMIRIFENFLLSI